MTSLGQIFSRTFFWSYDRGTWQYDLAVILILVFVLLTPRIWFRDQPQVGIPAAPGQVLMIAQDGKQEVYRVDARMLAPPEQTPALENDLHSAMQKASPELHDGHFSISKIEAVRDDHGTVIAYQVEIHH